MTKAITILILCFLAGAMLAHALLAHALYQPTVNDVYQAEDYADLMHEAAATQMFSFRAEYGYGREVLGMTVQVIPWMRGCLVMPANAKLRRPRQ